MQCGRGGLAQADSLSEGLSGGNDRLRGCAVQFCFKWICDRGAFGTLSVSGDREYRQKRDGEGNSFSENREGEKADVLQRFLSRK